MCVWEDGVHVVHAGLFCCTQGRLRATEPESARKTSPAQSPVVLIKRKEFLPFPF